MNSSSFGGQSNATKTLTVADLGIVRKTQKGVDSVHTTSAINIETEKVCDIEGSGLSHSDGSTIDQGDMHKHNALNMLVSNYELSSESGSEES